MGDQDTKARAFELAGEELKQKSVHEHAAREHDGVDALARADIAGDVCRGARDGDMEVERESVGGRSGFNFLQKCLKECFLVQNIGAVQPRWARCEIAGAVVGKTGDFAVQCTPSGGFELDGGFALVGCLAANAQNRGCGIKQATHAAGARAVDAALDHRCRYAARLLVKAVQEPHGSRVLEQVEFAEQGKGIAAGIVYGCGATGKRPSAQMRDALKIGETGDKKLTAPYGAIGAGARAIEGDAENACIGRKPACGNRLCHYARDVRMMVLDFDKRQIVLPCLLARPLARQIVGMHVACQGGRRQVKEAFQTRARGAPSIESRAVFDIADMLRHKTGCLAVRSFARECDRGFLLRPAGEHTGRGVVECRQRQRLRRISACATHGHDVAVDHAYHGVVVARQNRAVVTEQRVGDASGNKMLPCKGIVGLDGLFAQVSAGHDECLHAVRCSRGEQQML